MVIPAAYDWADSFMEGLCVVEVKKKYGFIDKNGTMVIAPQLRAKQMRGFHDGLAMVKEKKHWAFIDKTGAKVIQTKYEDVDPFDHGLAEVRRPVKSTNFLGAVLTLGAATAGHFIYDSVILDDEKIKRGYIDRNGVEVISAKNDYNSPFYNDMARVRIKYKWGLVDRAGAYIIEPKYKDIHFFYDDLAAVQDGDKWGFVGRDGAVVIAPKYDEVKDFSEGLAVVRQGQKSFFIDKTGRVPFLVPSTITDLGMFIAGLAPAKIGDKWGFIDHAGTVVIPPTYDETRTHQYTTDKL